jgi:hypothetical protein
MARAFAVAPTFRPSRFRSDPQNIQCRKHERKHRAIFNFNARTRARERCRPVQSVPDPRCVRWTSGRRSPVRSNRRRRARRCQARARRDSPGNRGRACYVGVGGGVRRTRSYHLAAGRLRGQHLPPDWGAYLVRLTFVGKLPTVGGVRAESPRRPRRPQIFPGPWLWSRLAMISICSPRMELSLLAT